MKKRSNIRQTPKSRSVQGAAKSTYVNGWIHGISTRNIKKSLLGKELIGREAMPGKQWDYHLLPKESPNRTFSLQEKMHYPVCLDT
ncbi:MAG: hypothetical protein AAF694_30805 [Bacteroidota bacterium]